MLPFSIGSLHDSGDPGVSNRQFHKRQCWGVYTNCDTWSHHCKSVSLSSMPAVESQVCMQYFSRGERAVIHDKADLVSVRLVCLPVSRSRANFVRQQIQIGPVIGHSWLSCRASRACSIQYPSLVHQKIASNFSSATITARVASLITARDMYLALIVSSTGNNLSGTYSWRCLHI